MEVLKQRLLKTGLFSWAYRQGGIDAFPLAQKDVLETMHADIEKKSEELANKKLAELLSIIDERMVLKVMKNQVHIGKEVAEPTRLMNLKSEAAFLLESDIWKILNETLKEVAQEAMFVSSESLVDLQKGKTILFTLKTQANLVKFLNALSTPSSRQA